MNFTVEFSCVDGVYFLNKFILNKYTDFLEQFTLLQDNAHAPIPVDFTAQQVDDFFQMLCDINLRDRIPKLINVGNVVTTYYISHFFLVKSDYQQHINNKLISLHISTEHLYLLDETDILTFLNTDVNHLKQIILQKRQDQYRALITDSINELPVNNRTKKHLRKKLSLYNITNPINSKNQSSLIDELIPILHGQCGFSTVEKFVFHIRLYDSGWDYQSKIHY